MATVLPAIVWCLVLACEVTPFAPLYVQWLCLISTGLIEVFRRQSVFSASHYSGTTVLFNATLGFEHLISFFNPFNAGKHLSRKVLAIYTVLTAELF